MTRKSLHLTAAAVLLGSAAFANTPLITNATFDGYPAASAFEGWIMGANRFQPADTWVEFVQAPDAFAFEDLLSPSGNGFTFTNWDDGIADKIETFLLNEFGAGPPGSPTENTTFETGDVIVFKGKVRHDAKDAGAVSRAFIKFLGYNELGWEFQLKPDQSRFFNTTDTLQEFELTTTFPDLAADDSFQVVQIGFEATGEFDGTFSNATVYFEDIEAYIEGTGPATWNGYTIGDNGWVDTGDWMGMVNVTEDPWIWVANLEAYIYIPAEGAGWAFVPNSAP